MDHTEFQNKNFTMVSHAVLIDTLKEINIIMALYGSGN